MQTICAIVCIYSLSCFFRYIFRYFNLKDLKKIVFPYNFAQTKQ